MLNPLLRCAHEVDFYFLHREKVGYIMKTSMLSSKLASAVFIALAPLLLSGCYENLHTHWAGAGDSQAKWSGMMPGMPVDVHSQDSSMASPTMLSRIPNATTANSYAQSHPVTQQLSQQPRVVLYIGGNQLPTSTSYCEAAPVLEPVHGAFDGVLIGGAICDGPRLVDTAQRTFKEERLASDGLAHAVDDVKSQLLFGLSVRQSKLAADSDAN
jgi:hypothetical protein